MGCTNLTRGPNPNQEKGPEGQNLPRMLPPANRLKLTCSCTRPRQCLAAPGKARSPLPRPRVPRPRSAGPGGAGGEGGEGFEEGAEERRRQRLVRRQAEVRGVLQEMPVPVGDPAVHWIATEWLKAWADSASDP